MPKARAKLDPVLLSKSGRRVEFLNFKFPLTLEDIDDVNLGGAVPGDTIVYSPQNGGWVPGSTTISVQTGSVQVAATPSAISQNLFVLDNGINPKGIIIDNQGLISQQYLVAAGGYPNTDTLWDSIETFNFSDNLEITSVELNSDTGSLTANIIGTDPLFAVYQDAGLLSENIRELNFIGNLTTSTAASQSYPNSAEQVNVEIQGYNILASAFNASGALSNISPLTILNGTGAVLNNLNTTFQLNTDLSLFDNSISRFGQSVWLLDTGSGVAYWPDPAKYNDLDNLRLGIGTDNPSARVEISRGFGTADVFNIENNTSAHLKISNSDFELSAENFLTTKIGPQGWTYIRNASDDERMDYTGLSDEELPLTSDAVSQAHISIHAKAQLRLHSDLGIFKFIAGEHAQTDENNIINHPRFEIQTIASTGATTLQTIQGTHSDLTLAAGANLNLSFKNLYLNGISTSTETNIVVIDSDGKVSKRAIDAITVDVSDFLTDGADNRVVTATGTDAMQAETYLTFANSSNLSRMEFLSNEDTGDKFQITTTTHGATTLVTTDDDATAAHFEIAADGDITLDSAGQIKLEPVAGSNILLDGTVTVDGGAIGGLASLTSSDDLNIVATGNDITVDTDNFTIESATANKPLVVIKNTTDDANKPKLQFQKMRTGDGLNDSDGIGAISFAGDNALGAFEEYGSIIVSALETGAGDEAGHMVLSVANDGTMETVIKGTANTATAGEVNVSIADGAASVTTIAGDLVITSNLTVSGTTTTVDTANTTITDSLLELNSGASSNANDSGFIIERGSTGDNALFIWDESADEFAIGTTTATATSTGNISFSYADFRAQNIGIGTSSPTARLHILEESGDSVPALKIDIEAGNAIEISDGSTNQGSLFEVRDNGDVFIGGNLGIGVTIPSTRGLSMPDNYKVMLGAGGDLQLYHDGSASRIADAGTGNLVISGTNLQLNDTATGENFVFCTSNAAVDIYYNGAKKFETTNTGVLVDGEISGTTLDINGAADIAGAITSVTTLTASGKIQTSGEVEGGSLDINGAADIAGAITSVTTLTASGKIQTSGEVEGGSLDINGAADIAGAITSVTTLTASGKIQTSGEVEGGSLDINGAGDISGDLDLGGDINMVDGKQLFLGTGTASDPSITFLADTDTGLRLHTAGSMRFVVGGGDVISFNSTGFFPITDDTVSLGLTGYRWSHVYTELLTSTGKIQTAGELEGGSLDINGAADIAGAITSVTTLTASGKIQTSGELEGTSLDINGDADISGVLVLNTLNAGFINEPKNIFTKTADGTHFEAQGDILYLGTGSVTQGDLCFLKEDGSWGQADADGAATGDDADRDAMGMLAIALGTDPDVNGMLIRGIITMDYDLGDVGNPVYVSTTAAAMTATAPSASGDFVRVLGYCLDDTHGQMYFNPDNAWVEIG